MTQPNTDELDILKNQYTNSDETETEDNTSEVEDTENSDDDIEALRAEVEKLKQYAQNQKIRAEKAESKIKDRPAGRTETSKQPELSAKDLLAISRAGIEADDLDEVLDYAKYKKISVSEALKSSVVKKTLEEKAEYRKTAEATNSGSNRRSSGKASDDTLLENARKGQLPESEEEMRRLILARRK